VKLDVLLDVYGDTSTQYAHYLQLMKTLVDDDIDLFTLRPALYCLF
jgi:hypothetical protein